MTTKNLELVDVALSETELLLIYGVLAPATRYPKDIKEKRLLNKTLLKIANAIIKIRKGANK